MALRSLISVSRAPINDAHDNKETDAMHNLKWNKQTKPSAALPQADRAAERSSAVHPVTEDELDAYRFGGKPIRRTVPAVSPLGSDRRPARS